MVDDVWLTGQSWNAARAHLPKKVEVLPFVLKGDVECALFRTAEAAGRWPWSPD